MMRRSRIAQVEKIQGNVQMRISPCRGNRKNAEMQKIDENYGEEKIHEEGQFQ
jgi:hypothetical protein